jgi:hypothetical protein
MCIKLKVYDVINAVITFLTLSIIGERISRMWQGRKSAGGLSMESLVESDLLTGCMGLPVAPIAA